MYVSMNVFITIPAVCPVVGGGARGGELTPGSACELGIRLITSEA